MVGPPKPPLPSSPSTVSASLIQVSSSHSPHCGPLKSKNCTLLPEVDAIFVVISKCHHLLILQADLGLKIVI